jgi:hypothetical protein
MGSPDAIEHLRGLTVRDRRTTMDRLERLLAHEPTIGVNTGPPHTFTTFTCLSVYSEMR